MRTSLSPRATIDATQDWNLDRKPSSLSLQQNMIKFMKSGGPSWAETTKSNETTDDDRMTCLKNRENARSCQFLFSVWSSAWKFHVSFLMQHLFKQRSEVVLSFIRIEIDGTNLCAHDLQVDCQWFVFFPSHAVFPSVPSTVWSFVVKFWIPESRLNMVASSSAVKYMDVLAPSLSTVVHLGNLNLNFKECLFVITLEWDSETRSVGDCYNLNTLPCLFPSTCF